MQPEGKSYACSLGDTVCVWNLKNIPEKVRSCQITEYSNGCVFLDWTPKDENYRGEGGFFLSMRACKMYVTQRLTKTKSLWIKSDEELPI